MALSTGNPALTKLTYESGTIGGVSYIDVDRVKANGSTTVYDALVPVYNGEYLEVFGMQMITAGTASSTADIGLTDASGTAIDADAFIDGAATSAAAGTLYAAAGVTGTFVAGGYLNATGATVYMTALSPVAADVLGKWRLFYQKTSLPLAV
jgi:hypothetical protein